MRKTLRRCLLDNFVSAKRKAGCCWPPNFWKRSRCCTTFWLNLGKKAWGRETRIPLRRRAEATDFRIPPQRGSSRAPIEVVTAAASTFSRTYQKWCAKNCTLRNLCKCVVEMKVLRRKRNDAETASTRSTIVWRSNTNRSSPRRNKHFRAVSNPVFLSCLANLAFGPKFYAHWNGAIPRRDGCPIQVIASPPSARNLSPRTPRGVPVYIKDGGTRTFSRRYVGSDRAA